MRLQYSLQNSKSFRLNAVQQLIGAYKVHLNEYQQFPGWKIAKSSTWNVLFQSKLYIYVSSSQEESLLNLTMMGGVVE